VAPRVLSKEHGGPFGIIVAQNGSEYRENSVGLQFALRPCMQTYPLRYPSGRRTTIMKLISSRVAHCLANAIGLRRGRVRAHAVVSLVTVSTLAAVGCSAPDDGTSESDLIHRVYLPAVYVPPKPVVMNSPDVILTQHIPDFQVPDFW
jgi:hypothetical protein